MSVVTSCDRCKKVITEVAYVLLAVDAQNPDIHRPVTGPTHLHWDCVPLYDRSDSGGEDGQVPL